MATTDPLKAAAQQVVAAWRKLAVAFVVGGAVAGGASFLARPEYRSTVAFVVQAPTGVSLPSSFQGLASQLGVGLGDQASQSPDFYAALATQDALAWSVLTDTFSVTFSTDVRRGTLLEWLEIDTSGLDPRELRERALREYMSRVQTRVSSRTGITQVAFTAPTPDLAAAVANRIVSRMSDYDLQIRRTSASNTRRFLDERVAEAGREVDAAKARLESFLERNRSVGAAPGLTLQLQGLQREAERLEAQRDQLVLQRDQSRINEISSVPALSIVDPAVPPFRKSSPKRRLWAAAGALLATSLAASVLFLRLVGEGLNPTVSGPIRAVVLGAENVGARLLHWF